MLKPVELRKNVSDDNENGSSSPELVKSYKKSRVYLNWTEKLQSNTFESHPYDLDLSAFMLTDSGKVPDQQYRAFIYYKNQWSYEHQPRDERAAIHLSEDVPKGQDVQIVDQLRSFEPTDEAEILDINFSNVPPEINRIVIAVTIYDAANRRQNFGSLEGCYLVVKDEETSMKSVYSIGAAFASHTAVEVGAFVRVGKKRRMRIAPDVWRFETIAEGFTGTTYLEEHRTLCAKYGIPVKEFQDD
jgi:tellurium resistance protein TerD